MVYRPRDRIWTSAALAVGPVSLADLKGHLRVTSNDEDDLIDAMGLAAAAIVEAETQRLVTVRTCTLNLPGLPSGRDLVELPGGAVVSVTSVVADGVAITGCTALGHSPAILLPAADWPTVTGLGYPVTITYTAGYAALPPDLVAAVKLIVGDLYEHRGNATEQNLSIIPTPSLAIMGRNRIKSI